MNNHEYLQLKKKIEERCKADLAALERVWSLSQDKIASSGDVEEASGGVPSNKKGSFTSTVRSVALAKDRPFTIGEIMEEVKRLHPSFTSMKRNAFSTVIIRLVGSKGLAIHEKGAGRTQSTYKVAK